jgi:hypothetical protein
MPNPKDPVAHERALWRMVDAAARTVSGIGVPAAPGAPTMTLRGPTVEPQPQALPSGAEEAAAIDNSAAMYQLSQDINAVWPTPTSAWCSGLC